MTDHRGKVLNRKTGRWVKKSGPIGKKIVSRKPKRVIRKRIVRKRVGKKVVRDPSGIYHLPSGREFIIVKGHRKYNF